MKVNVRNLDMYQEDELINPVFAKKEKAKKKSVKNDEFRKADNRKFNKPKHNIDIDCED